jgi:heat shock protein HspQ
MPENDDTERFPPTLPAPPLGHEGIRQRGEERGADKGLAKFGIGMSVQHRKFGFRGVIFDVDPEFANTEEWYNAIPAEVRPRKDQPFYHLFAVNPADSSPYIAYVSEQNLIPLPEEEDVPHPQLEDFFEGRRDDGQWLVPRDRVN